MVIRPFTRIVIVYGGISKKPRWSGTTIKCHYGQTIIEAVEDHGIEIPSSCRSGMCTTCSAKVLSGVVRQQRTDILDDKLVKEGYILTCCSYPVTDCAVETHHMYDFYDHE